jgi:peptidoglycan/xylan/chitin deacetylase (PgdA/CDA1 family)
MLNKLIIYFTDAIGLFLSIVRLDKTIRSRDDVRLVFYHGIGDKTSASMTYLNDEIPLHVFEAHIDYLQKKYVILSLKDMIDLIQADALPKDRPVCTISFDDGLHSVYSDAFPLLRDRGIPFDVFLNTSVIGNNDLLWLHALNYLSTTYGADRVAEEINNLIDADIQQTPLDALGLERWCRRNFQYFHDCELINKLFDKYGLSKAEVSTQQDLYLNWDQIEEMTESNVGFYSHTHRHFPLNAISNTDLIESEIKLAYDVMASHHKNNNFVSFPFGMEVDYGKIAITHAFSAGHKFIVEVGNGLNSPDKIINDGMISRVGLGGTGPDSAKLYASIEVRPVVKARLKTLFKR